MEAPQSSPTWIQHLRLHTNPSLQTPTNTQNVRGSLNADSASTDMADHQVSPPPPKRRAAVLVCLFEGETGEPRVLLTKRCPGISYPGEVSLPGGKVEEGDRDDADTATREAKEEIGLDPLLVKIVAILEPYMTKRFVSVTPVVGVLSDKRAFTLVPNTDEVEEIFDAPLEMFLKNENQRPEEKEWMGDRYILHHFDYETEKSKFVIWGLTSWILIQVASMVYQRPPDFVQLRPNYLLRSFLASESSA